LSGVVWEKRGRIYVPPGSLRWARTHAQLPTVEILDGERWRIYFSTRDEDNRSWTTYIEVSALDPRQVLYEHPDPILPLGAPGSFDEVGIMPACRVDVGDTKYLYYSGWALRDVVPYEIQIGLAASGDGGATWKKVSEEPVIGRIPTEPFLSSTPHVSVENGVWRAWYLSGTKWEVVDDRIESFYHLKYAESDDGVQWRREGVVAIDYDSEDEGGIVRPSIIREGGAYRMWYSARGARDFRTRSERGYRIGYAESDDGIRWTRIDDHAGIDVSSQGWDSEMIAYPHVFDHEGTKYMFYNGNYFGLAGFGYAVAR
jgi:hypothetical protein